LASILTNQWKPLLSCAPLLNYKHPLLNNTSSTYLFPAYLQIYIVLMFCCWGIDFQHQQAFWHHEPTFINPLWYLLSFVCLLPTCNTSIPLQHQDNTILPTNIYVKLYHFQEKYACTNLHKLLSWFSKDKIKPMLFCLSQNSKGHQNYFNRFKGQTV